MNKHNFLPLKWYIARLDCLYGWIGNLPEVRLGKSQGKETLRVYNGPYKRKEVRSTSKDWDRTYSVYKRRLLLKTQIEILNKELEDIYHTTYELERPKYQIQINADSKLNASFFNQLKDNDCSFANEHNYEFDGHNFRSRLEMIVAQKLKEMHVIYKYDCGINLYTKKCYGDMFLYFPEFNRCVCLEIMGKMDSADYVSRATEKFSDYSNAGYLIGRDWFILASTNHTIPTNDLIELTIANIVQILCAEYVKEIV